MTILESIQQSTFEHRLNHPFNFSLFCDGFGHERGLLSALTDLQTFPSLGGSGKKVPESSLAVSEPVCLLLNEDDKSA